MTLNELIAEISQHCWALLATFIALPLTALVAGFCHRRPLRRADRPRKFLAYFYSVLVYVAAVPGMFAAVITAYTVFFARANLMEVDFFVYVLPILSMVVTLILVRKNIEFDAVPGFDRLTGMMIIIGLSFAIALALYQMRLWLVFGSSIFTLLAFAAIAFSLLQWGTYTLFRRNDEPKRAMPLFEE